VGGWNEERFEEGSTALGDEKRWVDEIRRGLKRATKRLGWLGEWNEKRCEEGSTKRLGEMGGWYDKVGEGDTGSDGLME
jgi:hypothetical protein